MIISFTDEELQHLHELQESFWPEWEQLTNQIHKLEEELQGKTDRKALTDLYIKRQAVGDSMEEVLDAYTLTCQQERFKPIQEAGALAIVDNAREQAPIILELLHQQIIWCYDKLDADTLSKMRIGTVKKDKLLLDPDYAIHNIKEELKLHIDALRDDKQNLQALLKVIIETVETCPFADKKKATQTAHKQEAEALTFKHLPLSITPESAIFMPNMPMYHGKATDALAALSHKDVTENRDADKAVIQTEAGDYKIVINDFSKIKGKLSVNTHKLLSTGIAEFTQTNNYGAGAIIPKVVIPFEEYAHLLGYEIDERETDSPEAAAKEKKRAQEAIKTAKKRIRQDLELLQAMKWTWQEKVKGKGADFDSIILLERVAIRKGYIIMEFGRNMAEYLKQLPLTQYPQGLLAIDARSENAYKIGLKMAEHFSIDNNQVKGTATRLKVSTLLAVTNLPTIEDLQNETPDDSRHWDRRIKEYFEKALDALTGKVINNWEYVKQKGEPLTEEEAYNIADYETFISLYVQFELLNAPEHKDRLARRAKEKKAAAAQKADKKKRGRRRKPEK